MIILTSIYPFTGRLSPFKPEFHCKFMDMQPKSKGYLKKISTLQVVFFSETPLTFRLMHLQLLQCNSFFEIVRDLNKRKGKI